MPEGPTIVLMKEQCERFVGQTVISANGNAKIEMEYFAGKVFEEYRTWGKQSFLIFGNKTVRIHLLMFGSFSIDEQTKPDKSLRLHLRFGNGDLYFYTCSVKLIATNSLKEIEWSADVMSEEWSSAKARKKLKLYPEMMVCDALLDQNIFSGVGNIIKNEVLFRIQVHPESQIGALSSRKLTELITEARHYSFDFLKWKRDFVLKKHWLAHTKKICPRCSEKLIKKYCGKSQRRSFFCEKDQKLYIKNKG